METTPEYTTKNPRKKRGSRKQNEIVLECGKLLINLGEMKYLTSYSLKKTLL